MAQDLHFIMESKHSTFAGRLYLSHPNPPCRICTAGQRISTMVFAIFALALFLAASDPDETPLRQGLMLFCAALSGLAVLRFPIAHLVGRLSRRRSARPGSVQGKYSND